MPLPPPPPPPPLHQRVKLQAEVTLLKKEERDAENWAVVPSVRCTRVHTDTVFREREREKEYVKEKKEYARV